MRKISWRQALGWRLGRHYLDRRAPAGAMVAVASRLCGLHAQVLSSAEFTLWARVEGLERGWVSRATWEERALVKTWAMRGTLHLLPSEELPLWHAALGISPRYLRDKQWQKYFGLSQQELEKLSRMIGKALDGRLLTREELSREVASLSKSAKFGEKIGEGSWGTILKPAAFSGWLCFAPSVGQKVRFTHPRSWVPPTCEPVPPASATLEITRRYLSTYGPASIRDLGRWWGGGMTIARQWIKALADEAEQVDVEGEPRWMLAGDAGLATGAAYRRVVRLLPGFDQYVVAASPHAERLMPEGARTRIYRPQGWISPVLLIDGRFGGVWKHAIRGSSVGIEIAPFERLPAAVRKGAEHEAERFAAFLDLRCEVRFTEPGVAL